jgi:hypothetical protein
MLIFLPDQPPSKCDVLEVKLKDLRAAAQLVSNFTSTREIAAPTDTLMTDVSLVVRLVRFISFPRY